MKVHINVSVDQEFLTSLDRTCKRIGIDRSEFLSRCALLVMTRREDVVPPMPRAIDPQVKAYADSKFPSDA